MQEGRWTPITPSQFAHEREALAHLQELLPDTEPFRAWSNFTFTADTGHPYEVDLPPIGTGLLLRPPTDERHHATHRELPRERRRVRIYLVERNALQAQRAPQLAPVRGPCGCSARPRIRRRCRNSTVRWCGSARPSRDPLRLVDSPRRHPVRSPASDRGNPVHSRPVVHRPPW
ncbi:hypothetical protein EDC02_2073 [Micromonospora sp. Llam0]|uniref:hypothetical protein n=1 Tax=Micromonospora sp. Llam0 TaxID=2485143 RepID=UPI000F49B63A|nr:hypothetical protein [Micromonospora sp. Llam0]ROO60214.1 hypothetical protein EDC02_2073 [Micromonospora sp. Llam0]